MKKPTDSPIESASPCHFFDEIEGLAVPHRDENGVVVGGGVIAIDQKGGGVGRIGQAVKHSKIVENVAIHEQNAVIRAFEGGE